jgi:hypothetical protein
MALLLNNAGPSEVTARTCITVDVQGSPELQLECNCAAGITPDGPSKLVVSRLPTKLTIVGVVKAHLRQAGLGGSTIVSGQLAVGDKTNGWTIPIKISDFIRPVKMTTQQVGGVWAKHSQEKKATVATPAASQIATLVAALEAGLHVQNSEIINNEAILCGVIASAGAQTLLLHARADTTAGKASVTVRAESAILADSVAHEINHLQ